MFSTQLSAPEERNKQPILNVLLQRCAMPANNLLPVWQMAT